MLTWNKLTLLVEKITKQYNYDLHRIIIQFILKHEFAVFQAPMSVEVCLRKLTSVSPAEHQTHWEKKLHLRTFVNMRPESEIPLPLPEPVFGPSLHLPFGSLSQSLFLSHTHTHTHTCRAQCLESWFYLAALLKKGMATHSSSLAWRFPWTEEPGRLQSMG